MIHKKVSADYVFMMLVIFLAFNYAVMVMLWFLSFSVLLFFGAEIDYVKMQFWAVCVSCLGVLLFFHLVLRGSSHPPSSISHCGGKFARHCITLCSTFSYLSFSAICYYGKCYS